MGMSPTVLSWIGLFDLFRIGVGPSSSHTVGPMLAAGRFLSELPDGACMERIEVKLYGSLALTGRGHGIDRAIMLGLLGCHPGSLDPDEMPALIGQLEAERLLRLPGGGTITFDPALDIVFL